MKSYRSTRPGFEMQIPDEWQSPNSALFFGGDYSIVFTCNNYEAFNIQIGPLTTEQTLEETEVEFMKYVSNSGYSLLATGRILVAGQEHLWARYYMGSGRWNKKYLVVFGKIEYTMTATCIDQKFLLEREAVWDNVVRSFHPAEWAEVAQTPDTAIPQGLAEQERKALIQAAALVAPADNLRQTQDGDRAWNLDQAISLYKRALNLLDPKTMTGLWAGIHVNLGEAYRERIHGDRAENIREAISHAQQALEVVTQAAFPDAWAAAHENLGIAYQSADGDRAENIETAIDHLRQVLQVFPRSTASDDWALTQNNLGTAYQKRVRGNRAENIDQSIFHFQQALEVYTRQSNQSQWAATLFNLSLSYWMRINGDRAENLKQMIQCCQQSLEYSTRERYPDDWAVLQYRLGTAYFDLGGENRLENYPQAIDHFQKVLEVFTRPNRPKEWAYSHYCIGVSILHYQSAKEAAQGKPPIRYFMGLVTGQEQKEANIELAISHLNQALQVYTQSADSPNRGVTLYWLASAYENRVRGSHADNQEQAIQALDKALIAFSGQSESRQWAMALTYLAKVYFRREKGSREKNLDAAVRYSQQALTVYTRKAFPSEWAMEQVFQALVCMERKEGNRSQNIDQTISHFQQALEVINKDEFPDEWAEIQNSLSEVQQLREDSSQAVGTGLVYPYFYFEEAEKQPGENRTLTLIFAEINETPFHSNLLLVYQWGTDLPMKEAERLFQRTVAYVSCAIYDAGTCVGLKCTPSPVPNGRRPAWFIEGEAIPISLTLSDIRLEDRTCQLSIDTVLIQLGKPNGIHPWKALRAGFQKKFHQISV